ncbi:MAG: Uma2 family endonuclease [Acidobacteria bacterium]|nr:Uma2 family endonuclease [Acidobacteriota bacterium]
MNAASAQSLPKVDFKTYLEIEASASNRHEYWNGLVYAKAAGTFNHSVICISAAATFLRRINSKSCFVSNSDLKIETPSSRAAFYPDLSVHCNQLPSGTSVTAKSPTLILEVLSPSTRSYDLTTKRKEYFHIPTLRHYLTIDSESIEARLYSRDSKQTWPKDPQIFTDPKSLIPLQALRIKVKLKDLYAQTGLLAMPPLLIR